MKTYLIISPQPWGKMYLSKHNYALALAEQGHQVYFLNPPTYKKLTLVKDLLIRKEKDNLYVVDYCLPALVYMLRFKARFLYDFFLRTTLIKLLNKVADFDELWCFEPNVFSDFRPFNANKKLLFIVDFHDNPSLKKMGEGADGIISISSHILQFFDGCNRPRLLMNHGLNKNFSMLANEHLKLKLSTSIHSPIKVAYVGNLLQGDRVDYFTIQVIIEQNPNIDFHIYGPYEAKGNTLGTTMNNQLQHFLAFLKSQSNVMLHGIKVQTNLAKEMQEMDVFLTCYNYLTDFNKSSNCHKVIEYMSTGKVVIANRLFAYEGLADLIEMPKELTNENLPALFKKVISDISFYNSPEKQKKRIEFALENTYQEHIKTIEQFLHNSPSAKKQSLALLS